jgi:colanic acid/amylovoran biosynthesis glycosyltransferase
MTSIHRRDSFLLITCDYPFGGGEAFVRDEVSRLTQFGAVIVLPAFAPRGAAARTLPEGASLDTSLARRGLLSILRPSTLSSLARAAVSELASRPSLLVSPRSLVRLAGYLYRAGRLLDWVRAATGEGDPPRRVMTFWSNSEAFGMALAAAADPRIMLVSRSHRFDVWADENPGGYLPFRGVIARHAHRLLPSSQEAADHLRQVLPVSPDRVVVAPLGVDPPYEPDSWRDRDEILVVSCSTSAAVKRLPLVAASVRRAAEGDPGRRWSWIHLGTGEEQVKAVLADGPPNLDFESTGWVSREEIYAFYLSRQPNCLINLSSSEGVPLSILEALSMRIPVVATAAGGTAEMVDDSVGALLPVAVDAVTASAAIRRVVDAGESLRVAARDRFETRGSPAVAIDALRRNVPEFLECAG